MTPMVFAAALGAAVAFSAPAAALDLSKLPNPFGGDWTVKSAAPDLVRYVCGSPACPPSGEIAIALRPAPDSARDAVIADPEGTLAGYEKGFKNNPANKACEFSDFAAARDGEQASRFEMRGECPSGLVLMMATLFDKRQPGTISVVASSMDAPKAGAVRARAVAAIGAALSAAR
ncbi:hypothetical protein [Chenggangzhangella methanolivorans]|uniref:Uncharacterized protein n=1 Tax=Chenggangzhangella methanolivorans TaxID=1437009 RepID=A0A9E6UH21_9HYPH|nr:hypothetical protein [Chenggangzhangella methanolivorans]QZN99327.1 hypothetical protein K6K41_21480 [Chenggangzhangella methanolivorans]